MPTSCSPSACPALGSIAWPTDPCRPKPVFRARLGLPVGFLFTAPTTPAGLGAQRLKRVLGIDIAIRQSCGGAVRIIACIEDPVVIEKILAHLLAKAGESDAPRLPPCRAPPQRKLFD